MDNTLLDDNDPPRIKLCDFGFAKWWTDKPCMQTITGGPGESTRVIFCKALLVYVDVEPASLPAMLKPCCASWRPYAAGVSRLHRTQHSPCRRLPPPAACLLTSCLGLVSWPVNIHHHFWPV